MKRLKTELLSNPYFLTGIFVLITIAVTAQQILLHPKPLYEGGIKYLHYNNYIIFKQSFFHLIEQKDLYQLYLTEQWDLFKYSPTFSLLMAPMALLPDVLGLFIWNLLNALVLLFAIWKLPNQLATARLKMLGFIVIEMITALQNAQSNALIAGLIILAFIYLEKKQTALAALFIVLTIFIKIFGVVALALFIFYPHKWKAALYTAGWMLLLAILPLIVVSPSQLIFLYKSWGQMLQDDHSISLGLSVVGWLQTWFGIERSPITVVVGVLLFCLPFLKYKFFGELKFRLFFLASILIWVIIFNHRAESATFVIAVSGIAIWFFSQKTKTENIVLMVAAFILTVLSATDLFPKYLREHYTIPYMLKAVPCIFIWVKIIWDLIFYEAEEVV